MGKTVFATSLLMVLRPLMLIDPNAQLRQALSSLGWIKSLPSCPCAALHLCHGSPGKDFFPIPHLNLPSACLRPSINQFHSSRVESADWEEKTPNVHVHLISVLLHSQITAKRTDKKGFQTC